MRLHPAVWLGLLYFPIVHIVELADTTLRDGILTLISLDPFRLGYELGQGQLQSGGNSFCGVQIGASFRSFQQTDVGLMQACFPGQCRPAQTLFLTMFFDHMRKSIGHH